MDVQTINDFNNYIFLTNNDWAIKIEASDRRYLALELSNEVVTNKEYFDAIRWLHNLEVRKHFFHMLAGRDIRNWNPRAIPDTDLKRELKLNSMLSVIKFVIDMLRDDVEGAKCGEDGYLRIQGDSLFNLFNTWKDAQRIPDQISMQTFGKNINKIVKSKTIRFNGLAKRGFEFQFDETITAIQTYLKMPGADILSIG